MTDDKGTRRITIRLSSTLYKLLAHEAIDAETGMQELVERVLAQRAGVQYDTVQHTSGKRGRPRKREVL
jgi:hypothetical protein